MSAERLKYLFLDQEAVCILQVGRGLDCFERDILDTRKTHIKVNTKGMSSVVTWTNCDTPPPYIPALCEKLSHNTGTVVTYNIAERKVYLAPVPAQPPPTSDEDYAHVIIELGEAAGTIYNRMSETGEASPELWSRGFTAVRSLVAAAVSFARQNTW